jgi:[protein-PII] uridylyltransferase
VSQPPHPDNTLREALSARRQQLFRAYEARPKPQALLTGLRRAVDGTLDVLFRPLAQNLSFALVAVGGYGRGELYPHSDVDILLLLPDGADEDHGARLSPMIARLWDIGLEVGHSVRTVAECLDEAGRDITVQTNLLEARYLIGDHKLFQEFRAAFDAALDPHRFFEAKMLEQRQRHVRFFDAGGNLEPSVKESRGGLRDLHMILWLARATGRGGRLSELAAHGLLTRAELARLARQERFLSRLRIGLHLLAGRREDRLLFDYQGRLAGLFGIDDANRIKAAETLMRRYYRAAKIVTEFNEILLHTLGESTVPTPDARAEPLGRGFAARGDRLDIVNDDMFEREGTAILDGFLQLQANTGLIGFSARALRALWRARPRVDAAWRRDPVHRAQFLQVLAAPRRVHMALVLMNRYGLLGRILPVFGRIVGQMQHDLFHVYTVDEHILMVIRNLRRLTVPELAHEFPLASRLMAGCDRPWLLYVAALFHDIAKGRGGDHSTLGSRDARRFCREYDLSSDDAEFVAWLVREHLTLSSTAQKEDISDPEVVKGFAEKVGDVRRLAALYILTVADIRGTSPKVWNAWKARLLDTLYHAANRMLSSDDGAGTDIVETRRAEALTALRLYSLAEDGRPPLWRRMDASYFLRFDSEAIAWQTRRLWHHVDANEAVVRARLSPAGEGVEVLIYGPDRRELFARICAFFERINFSIQEARIHTTGDGYALDSFTALAADARSHGYRDLLQYIEHELAAQLRTGEPLPEPAQGRVSRRVKHFPIEPHVEISPDERGSHVLLLTAADRPGLLSRISRVFLAHGIRLYSAKVSTLGDRAEDSFIIRGAALEKPKEVLRLETDLLRAAAG